MTVDLHPKLIKFREARIWVDFGGPVLDSESRNLFHS